MPLAPLATTADLDARGITRDAAEAAVVDTLLDEASSIVRDAAGSPISQQTSTITVDTPRHGADLKLDMWNVTSVSAVTIDGTAAVGWYLTDRGLHRPGGWPWPAKVTLTVSHGAEVPADIVGLVCSMVAAGLKAFRESDDGSGLAARDPSIQSQSESVGQYSTSVAYATGSDAAEVSPTAMSLPQRTRERLRERFSGTAGMVTVRR